MLEQDRLVTRDWDLYDTRHVVFRPARITPETLKAGYDWAYEEFYRWSSIARASLSHGTVKHQAKHFFYAAGWEEVRSALEPDDSSEAVAVHVTPLLEFVLSEVTNGKNEAPLEHLAGGKTAIMPHGS